MTQEQQERLEGQELLDADLVSMACGVGHISALSLVSQIRGELDQEELELWYRLYRDLDPEEGDKSDDLYRLADYVTRRPDMVSGEQLWRKAAEMALHDGEADSYLDQPYEIRIAYRLFAKTVRESFVELQLEQRGLYQSQREVQKRQPIPKDDQTYAQDDHPMAKDPVFEAAADAIREMPKTTPPIATEHEEKQEDSEDPEEEEILSIGERPVAHQGKPKRGGARRPRQTKN